MVGVFLNAHVVEFIGAVGITDTIHEFGSLRFFAFRLFAGNRFRHQQEYRSAWHGQKHG